MKVKTTKETIRPQWNSRNKTWRIVKKTDSPGGGWGKFSEILVEFKTRKDCEEMISLLIEISPDIFQEG